MVDERRPTRPSARTPDDEAWALVEQAESGTLTTMRTDGRPISVPVWFVVLDRTIYIGSRGSELGHLRRDPRCSFLVEAGERWAQLRAVHLECDGAVLDVVDPSTVGRVNEAMRAKYANYRTAEGETLEASLERHLSAVGGLIQLRPNGEMLTWDNRRGFTDLTDRARTAGPATTARLPDIAFRPVLPELLRRAARRFGDDDYIVMTDRRLTFVEADRQSGLVARRLLASGVGKGTRVAISLPTGTDWVVAWLGAARIGAIPMLMPATYRPGELRRALRIGDAAVLITTPTLLGKDHEAHIEEAVPTLRGHDANPLLDPALPFLRQVWMMGSTSREWAKVLTTDDGEHSAPAVDETMLEAVEAEVVPADPLLVIYTSGSSADPKAIVHTHGAAIRKVQPELGMCLPGSFPGRTFCAMPLFWVGGPQNLLGALLSGAAVVVQERFDAAEALDLLERERCTSIVGWVSVYQQLRAHPTYPSRDLGALSFPDGQSITSSRGDPLNLGMTETFGPHANPDWFDYRVVDPQSGTVLADGEEGEFCIRGFGLMAGMYKREREEVFDTDGWYHTGDRGYIEDGRIWFTGRESEMIKCRGANVSPLEVEQVLSSFPDVRMAFVVGVADESGEEVVAAAVIPADGTPVDPDELRNRLRSELSSYKVPVRWLVADEATMPWLASGKADKRSLRRMLESAS